MGQVGDEPATVSKGSRLLASGVRIASYLGTGLLVAMVGAQLLFRFVMPAVMAKHVNAYWCVFTGLGICGGWVALLIRRARTGDAQSITRFRRAIGLALAALGLLAWDYTRANIGLLELGGAGWAFHEADEARRAVRPETLDRATARDRLLKALDGREYRHGGWVFRLKSESGATVQGSWYGLTITEIYFSYRDQPADERREEDRFAVGVLARPRSPGAYLVAKWEARWGFEFDQSTEAASPD